MLGHSIGTAVAQALAVLRPSEVRRLVLCAAFPGNGAVVLPPKDVLDAKEAAGWHPRKQGEIGTLVCADVEEQPLERHAASSRLQQKPHLLCPSFTAAALVL